SDTSFTMTWANITNAIDYKIDISKDILFGSYVVGYQDTAVGSTPNITVNGLTAGATYYVRVRAITSCGISVNSNIATVSVAITSTADGITWDNGVPESSKKVVFTGNALITNQLNACSCQVNAGANLVVGIPENVNSTAILKLENGLDVIGTGTLTF